MTYEYCIKYFRKAKSPKSTKSTGVKDNVEARTFRTEAEIIAGNYTYYYMNTIMGYKCERIQEWD